jgi:hypothetical protein
MRLRDLEPSFIKREREGFLRVDSIKDADGLWFLCPACYVANKGSKGTHALLCWSVKVGQDVTPRPGRWQLVGTCIDDLTLVAAQSSIRLTDSPCKAHFYIRNGVIVHA